VPALVLVPAEDKDALGQVLVLVPAEEEYALD